MYDADTFVRIIKQAKEITPRALAIGDDAVATLGNLAISANALITERWWHKFTGHDRKEIVQGRHTVNPRPSRNAHVQTVDDIVAPKNRRDGFLEPMGSDAVDPRRAVVCFPATRQAVVGVETVVGVRLISLPGESTHQLYGVPCYASLYWTTGCCGFKRDTHGLTMSCGMVVSRLAIDCGEPEALTSRSPHPRLRGVLSLECYESPSG